MIRRVGHAHAHGHSPGEIDVDATPVGRRPRAVLLAFLTLAAVATLIGLGSLWPDRSAVEELRAGATLTAPGVTYPTGTVVQLRPCPPTDSPGGARCGLLSATTEAGTEVTFEVPPPVAASGLEAGDPIRMMRVPDVPAEDAYSLWSVERQQPLGWLALAFVLVVVVVARLRGVRALIGLGVSAAIIGGFMLPALLSGRSGIGVALVGASAIMFTVLYLTHGLNLRTSAALAGTLTGVAVTASLGWWSVHTTRLTGVIEQGGQVLQGQAPELDFQGLLVCAVIIAGLGILNDVTITQASSVWELRAAAPELSRLAIFRSAMRIGRDHIASTIYTMTFAYTGAALTTLMLVHVFAQPLLQLVSAEEIAQEIVHTLVSGIGLVLAVPATTAIAALTVASAGRAGGRHVDNGSQSP